MTFAKFITNPGIEFILLILIMGIICLFSKKGSRTRKVAWISILFVIVRISVFPLNMIDFRLTAIAGYIVTLGCTYAALRYYSTKISPSLIMTAILLGTLIVEIPLRFFRFEATLISLPMAVMTFAGILPGYLLFRKKNWLSWGIAIFLFECSIGLYTNGYTLWLNKMNFGTFTGVQHQSKKNDYRFATTDGRQISLKELEGKVVILDFWSRYCGICFKKFPEVQKLYEQYKGNPDIFIAGVYLLSDVKESGAEADRLLRADNFTFPTLVCSQDNPILKDMAIRFVPTVTIWDKYGNFVYMGDIEDAIKVVNQLMNRTN